MEQTITDIPTGTLIHGTLRIQDLIPAFMEATRAYAPEQYAALTTAAMPAPPAYVYDEGDDSEWWETEDAYHLLEELVDALNDAAPEDTYFGAHPGDGSDFGFWSTDLLPEKIL